MRLEARLKCSLAIIDPFRSGSDPSNWRASSEFGGSPGWTGSAPDGQIEAVSVTDAPGFVCAVQWHPEHRARENPLSMKLFDAFRGACRTRAASRLAPLHAAAE